MQEVANATARAVQIESSREQKRDLLARRERQKQEEIDALKAEGARLHSEVSIGSAVKAPVAGRIEDDPRRPWRRRVARHRAGDDRPGEPADLRDPGRLRQHMAKRIVPGMDTHIRPVSVKKEEYGSMRGRVPRSASSAFPRPSSTPSCATPSSPTT